MMKHKLVLEIPKDKLDKYLKVAESNWDKDDKDNVEGENQGIGYRFELELPNENMNIEKDGEIYCYGDFRLPQDEDPIYYSLTIKPDAVDTIKFCEIVSKKMNKAKSLFESITG